MFTLGWQQWGGGGDGKHFEGKILFLIILKYNLSALEGISSLSNSSEISTDTVAAVHVLKLTLKFILANFLTNHSCCMVTSCYHQVENLCSFYVHS